MFNSSCSVATNPESPPGDIFTYRSARTSLHSSSAYLRNGAIHLRESAACIRKLHSESSEGTGREQAHFIRPTLGGYLRDTSGFFIGSSKRIQSCRILSGRERLKTYGAFRVFVEQLRRKLKETHAFRQGKPEKQQTLYPVSKLVEFSG
jgi:hypothetical protein